MRYGGLGGLYPCWAGHDGRTVAFLPLSLNQQHWGKVLNTPGTSRFQAGRVGACSSVQPGTEAALGQGTELEPRWILSTECDLKSGVLWCVDPSGPAAATIGLWWQPCRVFVLPLR